MDTNQYLTMNKIPVTQPLRGFLLCTDSSYICPMQHDDDFVKYWAENREKQKTSIRPLLVGMSSGFMIGILILVSLSSGWYLRAEMVANASFSSVVFILAILLLSFFLAFFYRKFRWEMQEQRYQELMAKRNRRHAANGPEKGS